MPSSIKASLPASGQRKSLEDVHSSVSINHARFFRRLFAFAGPAYMVSVGYMDPGNWATDIEGGSSFGYTLLWVLLLSNMMAVLLQTLSARMGIVSGRDLAQACREMYSRPVSILLWILCEIAIAACDLAEVIGTIVGLNLLFGLPMEIGLVITLLDTFVLLAIQRLGIRKMEAFILILVLTIGLCFILEILWAQPVWGDVVKGLVPQLNSKAPFVFTGIDQLYVAIGILGATVMPHNLYLHSALVQSRAVARTKEGIKQACRYNFIDSVVALNAAFFVNAAILVLAASAFFSQRVVIDEIQEAHRLLPQFLGTNAASTFFAIALLCAGQSSTLTGTLAGQIVMEGFVHLRMRAWVRRLVTRSIALLPAAVVIWLFGASKLTDLLVLSQVVLSLQLSFAVIPLILYTSSKKRMGQFANKIWVQLLAWIVAAIIIFLNAYLVVGQLTEWTTLIAQAGYSPLWMYLTAWPIAGGCLLLLAWLFVEQLVRHARKSQDAGTSAAALADKVSGSLKPSRYKRIGVAVENDIDDQVPLQHALSLAKQHEAELVIVHVVDGAGGQWYGSQTQDSEATTDLAYVDALAVRLGKKGITARGVLCYGNPADELVKAVRVEKLDFIVLRSHGHRFFADKFFGQTIDSLRHRVQIPMLAVR